MKMNLHFHSDILSSDSSEKISDNTFLLSLRKNTQCLVNLNDDILDLSFDKKVPYLQICKHKIKLTILFFLNLKIA